MNINKNNKTKVEAFAWWVINWRWLVIPVLLMVVVFAGSGGRLIKFKNDYRMFFSKQNPQLLSYEALQNIYTKDDNISFVLTAPGETVFSNDSLEAVAWLTDEAWKLPFTTRVDSLTNFQHSEAEEDDLTVEDLVTPGNIDQATLKKIKDVAYAEPLLYQRLIGDKENVTGINVTLTLPEKDAMETQKAAIAARKLRDQFLGEFPGFQVHLTGMVMLNNAFGEASILDMSSIIPLMYLAIIVMIAVLLRSFTGSLGTILVIMFSTIVAVGLMGWMGIPMSAPVATAPTMIMTLAVADSIHLLVTLLQLMRQGWSKREAIVESLRINFQPLFLTSLTTTIGFLSMNFSDAPPFRHLGNVVAMGVVVAWVFTILFLPAFIAILPVRVKQREEQKTSGWMDLFVDVVIRRRPIFLWSSVAVVVLLATLVPKIELNDQWVEYFSPRIEFRTDSDYATENLTGIYTIEYSVPSGESNGISNPNYLDKLDQFASWYKKQPGVLQVVTLTDVMKRLNKNMHGDNSDWYRLPDNRELAAQYLLLYEMSLPYGLDLNNQINVDKSASRISVIMQNVTTRETRNMISRAENWQENNFPVAMHATPASSTVMFAYIAERNIKSMLGASAIALVLISIVLVFAMRSIRYGAISLIPNIVPAVMGFGAWALLIGEIGLSLSTVTGMTLGIVVDDTVHFLSKYLRARREKGMDSENAVRYAFASVGKAMIVTTMVLVVGFGILSLSSFRLNSWMGQLTAIVIFFALVADFVLLPALLLTLDRKKANNPQYNAEGAAKYEDNLITA